MKGNSIYIWHIETKVAKPIFTRHNEVILNQYNINEEIIKPNLLQRGSLSHTLYCLVLSCSHHPSSGII